jgi:holo-[acyl-carrier protein] synthase
MHIALGPDSSGPGVRAGSANAALRRYCFRGSHKSTSIIGVGRLAERASDGGDLIIGMGVDIAEVERIQGAIERHGEVFLRRVYTDREREYCERFKNKYERYAGRFAAKEAAMKALGTGWRRGVKWVDLEVVRETSGRPTLAITGEAAKIAQQLGVKSVALSITHTESQALAQVIFEG